MVMDFYVTVTDPKTHKRHRILAGPIETRHLRNPLEIYRSPESPSGLMSITPKSAFECARLVESSYFDCLVDKPYLAAIWLCRRALIYRWNPSRASRIRVLPSSDLRRLFGMRQKVGAIVRELEAVRKSVQPIEDFHCLTESRMTKHLNRAISALGRFQGEAREEPSQRDRLGWARAENRLAWPFRPPALAYALYYLLRQHTKPRIKADQAYDLVGRFESEFLKHRVGDTVEVIRRQVRTFKKDSTFRREMDRIVARLLAADWSDEPESVSSNRVKTVSISPPSGANPTRDEVSSPSRPGR
jgi:hypothetical protein